MALGAQRKEVPGDSAALGRRIEIARFWFRSGIATGNFVRAASWLLSYSTPLPAILWC